MASTKIRANISHTGLWAEKQGIIASAKEVDFVDGPAYALTFHKGQMPAHEAERHNTLDSLETAMRTFEPNLRKWRLVGSGI